MRRPQDLKKISHLLWQNSCFYSVSSKQVGDFFLIFVAFSEKLDFKILQNHQRRFDWHYIGKKSTVEILQNFMAFSEYMNFIMYTVHINIKKMQLCKSVDSASCLRIVFIFSHVIYGVNFTLFFASHLA
jgi:hypothetical protein